MTTVMQSSSAQSNAFSGSSAPEGWEDVRSDPDIQFERVDIPQQPPREPNWFEKMIQSVLEFLADLLAPVGRALGSSWPVLQWILLGLLVLFVAYLIYRLVDPGWFGRNASNAAEGEDEGWAPDQEESIALLEDADKLAAEGRFDEATHLLLKRSVTHIAAARPDWVEPSSTARELAALPALSDAARGAFRIISERVERSLFALRSLDRTDWEAARSAYAEFALAKIGESRALGTQA
ncbi:hypothetical protein [uncultured Erythrobacter sp.]|uniref:hypothetical protein n=1 Tax=uncultured Erythrobacter sp. TaxID=263913 RepID=UPI0026302B71|nr:hypothetical protein [uncultured Erythrobacter sp.]